MDDSDPVPTWTTTVSYQITARLEDGEPQE